MTIYRVVAIVDISKPQERPVADAIGGRVLETMAEELEEGQSEQGRLKDSHCFKFALIEENDASASPKITLAFELIPLPFNARQLLGSCLRIEGAQCKRGALLLTPSNASLISSSSSIIDAESANPTTTTIPEAEFQWDEHDLNAFINDEIILID